MNKTIALSLIILATSILSCSSMNFAGVPVSLVTLTPHVTNTAAVTVTPAAPQPNLPVSANAAQIFLVCGGQVNVRADGDPNAEIIGILGGNAPVIQVLGDNGELAMKTATDGGRWAKVSTLSAKITGWVNSRYLCLKGN